MLLFRTRSQIVIELTESSSADVHINYKGTNTLLLGKKGRFQGNVIAPNARVKVAADAGFQGTISARSISVMQNARIRHHNIPGGIPKPAEEIVSTDNNSVVTDYALEQNHPNPFQSHHKNKVRLTASRNGQAAGL